MNTIVKKILSVLLAATLLLTLGACSKDQTPTQPSGSEGSSSTPVPVVTRMDKIKEAGVLVVGTSADYPPYEFHAEIDGVDTITGYDMMVAKAIADSLGVQLQIEDMAFEGLLISLQEDMFDLVLAGISKTPERSQAADFTIETTISSLEAWKVVIRAEDDAKFNTTADFADSIIGIQNATVYISAAVEMTGEEDVVELSSFPDLIMDLQNGHIDALVANAKTCDAYASGNADLLSKDVGIVNDSPGQSAAIKKGQDEWMAYLDEQILALHESGKLEEFMEQAQSMADASGADDAA